MLAGRDFLSSVSFLTKITTYPNGAVDLISAERPVFRREGWEAAYGSAGERKSSARRCVKDGRPEGQADVPRAVRRAKARVRQIALANDFDYFVTLTQDPGKVNRYDEKESIRKLSKWCENQVQRYGLRYVVIPERHKDGAIHYHGFMSWDGDAGDGVVESGTYTMKGWKKPRKPRSEGQAKTWLDGGARVVYNLPRWRLGFSTALKVYGEYGAAVGYVCKYVGKQMEGSKIGGRWYYSGGRLRQPVEGFCNLSVEDMDSIPGTFSVDNPAVGKLRLWRGSGDVLAECLGPLLEKRADSDFIERFYTENPGDSVSSETIDDDFEPLRFEELGDDVETPFL